MSKSTQDKFIKYIDEEETHFLSNFTIKNKDLSIDGFVSRITYYFSEGLVEFLCGPPEYHVEMFISIKAADRNLERYDLTKLMSIPLLQDWIIKNKPDINHDDKIKAEIKWHVSLLRELKKLPNFYHLCI